VKERRLFGKLLSDFQNTRHRLAEMQTDYRLASAFVEECIAAHLDGALDVESASIAKLAASEAQGRVVDGCLQLFGGYGYMTEYPIARAFVDARVQRIYGGTSEVMKELISRSVLA
jgi:acyl-CoA dehydrogenase